MRLLHFTHNDNQDIYTMNYSTEEVWDNFNKQLYSFIYKRVNNKVEAEDILQNVFIKIHKNIESLTESEKLPAWIYSIARNTIIDYYRNSGNKINIEFNEDFIVPEIEVEGDLYCQIKACLSSFVKILPEKYRDSVELSELRGMKQKDVAETLSISLPAAKSRILRGKEMIKQHFIDCCKFKLDDNGKLIGGDWPNENCEECETCSP